MNDEEIKAAEKRGYARGYERGRVRRKRDIDLERHRKANQAFLERVFVAALPICITVQGWQKDGRPITTISERVGLSWEFAENALKNRRYAK